MPNWFLSLTHVFDDSPLVCDRGRSRVPPRSRVLAVAAHLDQVATLGSFIEGALHVFKGSIAVRVPERVLHQISAVDDGFALEVLVASVRHRATGVRAASCS